MESHIFFLLGAYTLQQQHILIQRQTFTKSDCSGIETSTKLLNFSIFRGLQSSMFIVVKSKLRVLKKYETLELHVLFQVLLKSPKLGDGNV